MKVATNQERLIELFDSDSRNDTSIAKALHVSKQTISAWRNGVRSPKKTMVVKIAQEYHVSIEWLMGFDVDREEGKRNIIIPDSELFSKLIVGMTPSDYETVMNILEKTEIAMRERGEL